MFERSELVLKIACFVLGAFLVYQIASLVMRANPLRRVSMPELPSLSSATNAASGAKETNSTANPAAVKMETNSIATVGSTNMESNIVSGSASEKKGTNAAAVKEAAKVDANSVVKQDSAKPETNSTLSATNQAGTNSISEQPAGKKDTNAPAKSAVVAHPPPPGAMPGQGAPPSDLPPLIQARIDRIYQSEILGQVMRPMPMGLLGIAGENAFLRSPSGQTGMVKAGDELGGIKLLRIGTNRVLVEEKGEQKELTIFSGFGGESLLPKQKDTTNETLTKSK